MDTSQIYASFQAKNSAKHCGFFQKKFDHIKHVAVVRLIESLTIMADKDELRERRKAFYDRKFSQQQAKSPEVPLNPPVPAASPSEPRISRKKQKNGRMY